MCCVVMGLCVLYCIHRFVCLCGGYWEFLLCPVCVCCYVVELFGYSIGLSCCVGCLFVLCGVVLCVCLCYVVPVVDMGVGFVLSYLMDIGVCSRGRTNSSRGRTNPVVSNCGRTTSRGIQLW